MDDLGNTTTQVDITPEIYVTDKAVMRTVPIKDGGLTMGYYTETIMTKEVFIECYNRWIAQRM